MIFKYWVCTADKFNQVILDLNGDQDVSNQEIKCVYKKYNKIQKSQYFIQLVNKLFSY